MRSRRTVSISAVGALVLLMLAPTVAASHPQPLNTGPLLQSAAFNALNRELYTNGFYLPAEGGSVFYVQDQMLAVLAILRAAELRPDQRSALQQQALAIWNAAQESYDPIGRFYHRPIPPPSNSVCIDPTVQAWAVRATRALQVVPQTNTSLLTSRVTEGRNALVSLLETGAYASRGSCSANILYNPIPLLALLETRNVADSRIDNIIMRELDRLIGLQSEGAFVEREGLVLARVNAQMLLVLAEAHRVYDQERYARARDDVLRFLLEETLQSGEEGLRVVDMQREDGNFTVVGTGSAHNQIWLMSALTHLQSLHPERVSNEILTSLSNTMLDRYWSPSQGAFVTPGELVAMEINALVAMVAGGPMLQGIGLDAASIVLILPARPEHDYNASRNDPTLVSNDWDVRFLLSAPSPTRADVVLTPDEMRAFGFTGGGSDFLPSAGLTRTGPGGTRVPVPAQTIPGRTDLLRFSVDLTSLPSSLRLESYAPLVPLRSEVGSTVRLFVENNAPDKVQLRSLRIEFAASEIGIRLVRLNDQVYPTSQLEVVPDVTTPELPQQHVRLILNEPSFQPGLNELVIEYTDVRRPEINSVVLTGDADGNRVIQAGPSTSPTATVLQGQALYVRAVVRDNVLLRSVVLRYQQGPEVAEVQMREGDRGVFSAQIPQRDSGSGPLQAQVVVVDYASNLNQSAALVIEITNPLLSGSRVLFAFSGTLFLSAFVIWLKVRRKTA